MKKIVLLALVLMACMMSCESRTYADISVAVPNPTYEANIKAIIEANCISCHSENEVNRPQLTNYQQVRHAAEDLNLLCKVNAQCGVMPESGKMPQVTVDMINLWAEQGFREK